MTGKEIRLASGTERGGFKWNLRITVYPLSSNFTGAFKLSSAEQAHRHLIRSKDRMYVRRHFGCYRGEFEIHHDWQNGAWMYLVTHARHRELDAEGSA